MCEVNEIKILQLNKIPDIIITIYYNLSAIWKYFKNKTTVEYETDRRRIGTRIYGTK